MLCKGFIREDEHPKMGLNVGRQKRQMTPPHGISYDMCTPGHTAAKHVPAKPPVAIPLQCLKPLTHIQQFSKLQRNARKEALQINRTLILHPACTTYALLRGSVHGFQRCFSVFEKQARITLGLSGTFQEILSFLDRLLFW